MARTYLSNILGGLLAAVAFAAAGAAWRHARRPYFIPFQNENWNEEMEALLARASVSPFGQFSGVHQWPHLGVHRGSRQAMSIQSRARQASLAPEPSCGWYCYPVVTFDTRIACPSQVMAPIEGLPPPGLMRRATSPVSGSRK